MTKKTKQETLEVVEEKYFSELKIKYIALILNTHLIQLISLFFLVFSLNF